MHILISNDDGYDAPGLISLFDHLAQFDWKLTVVSTKENKSGCGHGLSLRREINVEQTQPSFYVVDGTPADCVYIGLQCLVGTPVDVVLSGINNGANLGDDVLYSGTFAAAMEARRLRLPSIAVSIVEHEVNHYATAARVASMLLQDLPNLMKHDDMAVLNVNLPDVPYEQLRGFRATKLGWRNEAEQPSMQLINGESYYRLGLAGEFATSGEEYDHGAVDSGYVSVTPLSSQFEHKSFIPGVQSWVNKL